MDGKKHELQTTAHLSHKYKVFHINYTCVNSNTFAKNNSIRIKNTTICSFLSVEYYDIRKNAVLNRVFKQSIISFVMVMTVQIGERQVHTTTHIMEASITFSRQYHMYKKNNNVY